MGYYDEPQEAATVNIDKDGLITLTIVSTGMYIQWSGKLFDDMVNLVNDMRKQMREKGGLEGK